MEALQQDQDCTNLSVHSDVERLWEESTSTGILGAGPGKPSNLSESRPSCSGSDELLAATAILCVYEFLDASGSAWSRHLNGTKSLLDIAQVRIMQIELPTVSGSFRLLQGLRKPSKARKAIFWNFARQDCLAACKHSPLSLGLYYR